MRYLVDTVKMIRDIRRVSRSLKFWGPALNLPQVLGGFVFYTEPLAIIIALVCAATVLFAAQVHRLQSFSRLTSISHAPWLVMVPYIIDALYETQLTSAYGIWLVYVFVTMAIRLILDARNVLKFVFQGDHTFAESSGTAE